MKTILSTFLFLFIFGIIQPALTAKAPKETKITIRVTDEKCTTQQLDLAAKIISGRLNDCYSGNFDWSVSPDKRAITVTIHSISDLGKLEQLLTQPGHMAFYETWDRTTLATQWKESKELFALFQDAKSSSSDWMIGRADARKAVVIDHFLETSSHLERGRFVWNLTADGLQSGLYALRTDSHGQPLLTGSAISRVQISKDKSSGNVEIGIDLKKEAAVQWAEATRSNINRAIAIVLDNKVLAAPVVRSVIEGGKCVITGDYSEEQARWIAALANNGILPVRFAVVK